MKKILIIATMAATMTGLTALGQGNFIFGTGGSVVWNTANGTRGGAFNTAFLWGTGSPSVATAAGIAFTPTNSISSVNPATAWNSILNDPNYKFGVNTNSGSVAVGTLTAAGGINYNAGGNFPVQGTLAGGGTVNVYMIAWGSAYATPALAAAAGSPVGWSIPFSYTYAANPGAASGNFSTAAVADGVGIAFGVSGVSVPEPASFALAGLGAAAMLIFRRRK